MRAVNSYCCTVCEKSLAGEGGYQDKNKEWYCWTHAPASIRAEALLPEPTNKRERAAQDLALRIRSVVSDEESEEHTADAALWTDLERMANAVLGLEG